MHDKVLPAFWRFPREGEIVGRLLAGYTDLEFELAVCLGGALDSVDVALRTLFRVRGEELRIQVADGLMRGSFVAKDFRELYDQMIGDLKYCKQLRNQYAHCHWYDTTGEGLCFIELENWAKTSSPYVMQKRHPIDVPLLQAQETYFRYVQRCLWYLQQEYARASNRPIHGLHELPDKLERPAKYQGAPR